MNKFWCFCLIVSTTLYRFIINAALIVEVPFWLCSAIKVTVGFSMSTVSPGCSLMKSLGFPLTYSWFRRRYHPLWCWSSFSSRFLSCVFSEVLKYGHLCPKKALYSLVWKTCPCWKPKIHHCSGCPRLFSFPSWANKGSDRALLLTVHSTIVYMWNQMFQQHRNKQIGWNKKHRRLSKLGKTSLCVGSGSTSVWSHWDSLWLLP